MKIHDNGVVELTGDTKLPVSATTCGTCGRTWDDGVVTGVTPVPSGRCPFEYEHVDPCKLQMEQTCEHVRDELEFVLAHEGEVFDDIDEDEREGFDEEDLQQESGEPLSISDYCAQMALSIEVYGRRSAGDDEWTATHVEVVFGTGGPHIEFTTNDGGMHGYWGGDQVRRGVSRDVADAVESAFIDF